MRLVLIGLLLVPWLTGCAVPGAINAVSSAVTMTQVRDKTAAGDYAGALPLIRSEISNPGITMPTYLVDIRTVGINVLGNYASGFGFTPELDTEAQRYYREALTLVEPGGEREAQVHNVLAGYYSNTGRNGLALPYLRKELAYYLKAGNTYQVIRSYDAFASLYADMGEPDAANAFNLKKFEMAANYFVLGRQPTDANLWHQYIRMVRKSADEAATRKDTRSLENHWTIIEAASQRYIAPVASSYLGGAEFFAIAGQADRAERLHRQAIELWDGGEKAKFASQAAAMAVDITCNRATLAFHRGEYARSADLNADCISGFRGLGRDPGASIFRNAGDAHERAGRSAQALENFETAIGYYERARASYPIASRASFFRSAPVRKAYWGPIRLHAREAQASGARFFDALSASERIRARQFGETVDPQGGARAEASVLERLANGLPAATAVVSIVAMDDELVLLGFDRTRRFARVLPIGRDALADLTQPILDSLADPTSNIASLERRLLDLSTRLFLGAEDLLRDKTRLIVLPDGALAALPFSLLSVDTGRYRPFVLQGQVEVVPALRLLGRPALTVQAPAGKTLLALADPKYPASYSPDELAAANARLVLRGRIAGLNFSPLPETRTEVESISRLLGPQSTTLRLGAEARESFLKQTDLKPYRYLHFATHGVLAGEVPGLGEPALILAEEPGEDGFLRASEVLDLKLNADLAILSACNTGSGQYVAGEGTIGLSRAFLIAGSKAVIVSLWPVASKETEDLMVGFYAAERDTGDPSAALRKAMLDMRQKRPHPMFWAPFILVRG